MTGERSTLMQLCCPLPKVLGTELMFALSQRSIMHSVEKVGSPTIRVSDLCSKYNSRKFVLLVALVLILRYFLSFISLLLDS